MPIPHEHSESESMAQPQGPQCLICLNNELINLRGQVKTLQSNLNEVTVIRGLLLKRDAVIEYIENRMEKMRGE